MADTSKHDRPASRPVAVLDLPWVLMETRRHPMHVAGLLICDRDADGTPVFGTVPTDTSGPVSDPFNRRLDRRGRGRLWPRWETVPSLRLGDHVHRCVLPPPGGRPELDALVSELHRAPLNMTRPLWEVHLIEGLAADRCAVYAKFHHSLVDGVGALRVLQSAFTADPATRDMPPVWAHPLPDRREPTRRRTSRRAVASGVHTMWTASAHTRSRGGARPYTAPPSVLNTVIDPGRHVQTQRFEIDQVTRLARAMGGTLNDAYVTICASGLRRFLLDVDALPAEPLVAAVPVSVRPTDGAHLGNAITFAFVSLATDLADGRARAARITTSMAEAKTQLARVPRSALSTYTVLTMAPFIASQLLGIGARTAPMFNVAISNVPGPRAQLHHDGLPLHEIYPVSILQSGQALNITALSYAGGLHVTYTACDTRLPDVARLPGHCADALRELLANHGVAKTV